MDIDELNDEEYHQLTNEVWSSNIKDKRGNHNLSVYSAHLDPKSRYIKERDYEALRPFFAWKPVELIRDTFKNTTQYTKNEMCIPMWRHFKSRFPGLNVRRLNEDVATDTFFANVKYHDGSTCVQLFVGRQSKLTDIFGMKTESEMSQALMDFIRKWGAMKGLKSDNAKSETSKSVMDILRQYNIQDMQS